MRITIAQRLLPFSHIPGVICPIPGISTRVQVFPALVRIYDPNLCGEFSLPIQGPVNDFTVILNLEVGEIRVFGKGLKGYFRYRIISTQNGIQLVPEKGGIPSQIVPLAKPQSTRPIPPERLSLGMHKAQDWTMVERRGNVAEILPFWYRLGLWYNPQLSPGSSLLGLCKDSKDPYEDFSNLWRAGFVGMLSPTCKDEKYQGFALDPCCDDSIAILSEGARYIRSLFIKQNENQIAILPNLPPQFHCGRMTGLEFPGVGQLDLEWSKKRIRRMILTPTQETQIQFQFPKNIRSMRLHSKNKIHSLSASSFIDISLGDRYLLDKFEQ